MELTRINCLLTCNNSATDSTLSSFKIAQASILSWIKAVNLETEEQLMESKPGKISLPLSRYENTLLLLNTLIYLWDMQRSDHDLR